MSPDHETPRTSEAPERLFVYGTLAPGRPNAHVLADVPGTWEDAVLPGRLVEQGWGAALGFPALELADGDDRVPGVVLTSTALAAHWGRLDAFEGDGYRRVTTTVELADGRSAPAEVYVAADVTPMSTSTGSGPD